ncbi:hypothetical protein EGW08_006053, partial [Elysia chlorotica]
MPVAVRTRTRQCEADPRQRGQLLCSRPCPGVDLQTEKCVESTWSQWGGWSACANAQGRFDSNTNEPCGTGAGRQSRTRTCLVGTCGRGCDGEATEYNSNCYLKPCCEDPVWSAWGEWGACTERGYQTRRRMCYADERNWRSPTCVNRPCQGRGDQVQRCDASQAPQLQCSCAPRKWSSWGAWSPCGSRSGQSDRVRTRSRKCEGDSRSRDLWCPAPCPGDESETDTCCSESEWGLWSSWSSCSSNSDLTDHDTGEPCGAGVGSRNRTRVCVPGTCRNQCEGDHIEHSTDCYLKPCCELPSLTQWGAWEECTGNGLTDRMGKLMQSRRRACQPNAQKWDAPVCKRNTLCDRARLVESRFCKCEIPLWSSWGEWSRCNFKETYPSRTRVRSCNNPSGGSPECAHMCCAGADTQKQACICERARYSSWGKFDECKYNAGHLMMRRYRQCQKQKNPDYCRDAPYSWRNCVGRLMEEVPCC